MNKYICRERLVFCVLLLCVTVMPSFGESAAEPRAPWLGLSRFSAGVSGGYVYNHLYTTTANRAFSKYQDGHGFSAALLARYSVFDWLAVQIEGAYMQKNYGWTRTGIWDGEHKKITNSFIDVPIMAQFSFGGKRLRGFFNAGGYLGGWVASHVKGSTLTTNMDPNDTGRGMQYADSDEKVPFDSRRDFRFDAGLLAGAGIRYDFGPCAAFVEGRYLYGLTNMQKEYTNSIPRYNNTINVSLGVLINFDLFSRKEAGK